MRSFIIRDHTTEDKQQTTEEFVSITLLGIELFSRHEIRYSIKSHGLTTTRILGITVWTREYDGSQFCKTIFKLFGRLPLYQKNKNWEGYPF